MDLSADNSSGYELAVPESCRVQKSLELGSFFFAVEGLFYLDLPSGAHREKSPVLQPRFAIVAVAGPCYDLAAFQHLQRAIRSCFSSGETMPQCRPCSLHTGRHDVAPALLICLFGILPLAGCSSWPWRDGAVPESVANCRELSQQAITCIEANRWQEAEGLLDRAVAYCPIDPDARRYYAEALLQRGATEEALAQLKEAISLTPNDTTLVVRTGEIYFYRGDYATAQRWANEAINLDPSSVDAWALRGRIQLANGHPREALADFQRALGYRPEDGRLLGEVAEVYMTLGRPGRALLHLQNFTDTFISGKVPTELHERKGDTLVALGRHQDAAICYRLASQREKQSVDLLYKLAEAEWRLGHLEQSRSAIEHALRIDPQHQASGWLLSQLPESTGATYR